MYRIYIHMWVSTTAYGGFFLFFFCERYSLEHLFVWIFGMCIWMCECVCVWVLSLNIWKYDGRVRWAFSFSKCSLLFFSSPVYCLLNQFILLSSIHSLYLSLSIGLSLSLIDVRFSFVPFPYPYVYHTFHNFFPTISTCRLKFDILLHLPKITTSTSNIECNLLE